MVVDIASIQAESEDVAIFVINDWVEEYMLKKLSKKVQVFLIKRKSKGKNPWPIFKLNYLMWRFNPDIIHSHSSNAIRCVKIGKNIPKVRTIHGIGNSEKEYPIYKGLIAISDAVREFTLTQGYESTTIWNGIKTHEINFCRKNIFNDQKLHFIQVSRLDITTKGQDIVLGAIKILKDNGVTGFVVHFVGDGPSQEMLKNKTKELKIENYVIFEGRWPQQKIYSELCCFDLFIQASRREGFGLTIAEAMAAKVPVLVSDIPATMEVISHGQYGLYFKSEDSYSLADQISKYLKNGHDMYKIEAAYKYTASNYDIRATAARYTDFCKTLVVM